MPDSYTNLLYHIVFSTKNRRPLISLDTSRDFTITLVERFARSVEFVWN